MFFAVWLTRRGRSVLVVDTDPQLSAQMWLESLSEGYRPDVRAALTSTELLELVATQRDQYDDIVIDGPGGDSEISRSTMLLTDKVMSPCIPGGLDLAGTAQMVRVIEQMRKVQGGRPSYNVVINRAKRGTLLLSDSITAIDELYERVPTIIHAKQAIADCFGQDMTIWDCTGRAASEAKREFEAVFKNFVGEE